MKSSGNSEKAKVSVVIPAYNVGDYISKSVQSALSQTYRNVEVVVVDDGSRDHTWQEIQRVAVGDDRVVAVRQSNRGAAVARNTALEKCTGEFITFLDGDDTLQPDTIELNMQLFEDGIDWVEFPVIRVDGSGQRVEDKDIGCHFEPREFQRIERESFIDAFLTKRISGLVCGSIYRRSAIMDVRFPDGIYYEDSFYYFDVLMQSHRGAVSPYGKYFYLTRSDSSQHISIDGKRLYSKMKYSLKLINGIKDHFPDDVQRIQQSYPQLYFYYKLQCVKKNSWRGRVFS